MQFQRIHALPSQVRLLVLSYRTSIFRGSGSTIRHTFQRSQHSAPPGLQLFKNNKSPTRLWRNLAWLIPVTGGVALYLYPSQQLHPASVFSSPTLIPCTKHDLNVPTRDPIIGSPAEPHMSIPSRILSLLQEHFWEPLLTARRFIHLFYLFIPVIITMPMLLVGKPERRYKGDKWGAIWWYGFLVRRMQTAGPTFIKLAQWAASRADLFPSLLCEKMAALHSRGKPHSLMHTKQVIERALERPFDEVFEVFDENPIGVGAIAQVYRATLKHDLIPPSYLGPKRQTKSPAGSLAPVILQDPPPSVPTASVAIKVLHPRVAKDIAHDLSIMAFFARIITLFPGMQWLSLPEEVSVFGEMMRRQLDLRIEAENLLTFENNFASRNVPVSFPRPLKTFSTADLLVEEYENALRMEYFLKNGGGPFDEQLATNMLLLDNFVHSDLHPGNIMIKFTKPPTTRDLLMSIYSSFFLQKGSTEVLVERPLESDEIVARLRSLRHSRDEWQEELKISSEQGYIPEINFLDLFRAVAEFDGYRAGQLMVERCRTPELAIDTETFALKMQHIVLSIKRKTFSLGQIKISDILTDVLTAVRQHHVKMEADFINTVISILLLEGIGRQLDPSLDLFKSALPILRQLGRQMTTQESMTQLPSGNFGALLKVWMWAFIDVDELVKYDL
ncbi:hypothetical protein EDB19DRAFT_1655993 [Suillus lakei]|nr:hypothetical protein EDB19DRAFT_1655993 [Suillus lakei]